MLMVRNVLFISLKSLLMWLLCEEVTQTCARFCTLPVLPCYSAGKANFIVKYSATFGCCLYIAPPLLTLLDGSCAVPLCFCGTPVTMSCPAQSPPQGCLSGMAVKFCNTKANEVKAEGRLNLWQSQAHGSPFHRYFTVVDLLLKNSLKD